jgi:hypothetical protein
LLLISSPLRDAAFDVLQASPCLAHGAASDVQKAVRLHSRESQQMMRTLNKTDFRGSGTHGATLNPVIWLVAPPTRRGNQIHSLGTSDLFRTEGGESPAIPLEAEGSERSEDDFPFSALIRFVRQMRQ